MTSDSPLQPSPLIAARNRLINEWYKRLPSRVISLRHRRRHTGPLQPWLSEPYLFLHVPKTAGTSIAGAFELAEPGHHTYAELERSTEVSKFEGHFFVLRDPVERVESTYYYILSLHSRFGTSTLPEVFLSKSLNDFVMNHLNRRMVANHYFLRSASQIISGADPARTYAINFDNLTNAFAAFSEEVLGRRLDLGRANESNRTLSRQRLSPEAIAKIGELYRSDKRMHDALADFDFRRVSDIDAD